jgi:eukaryotic-like serine/threonine-protein kinase
MDTVENRLGMDNEPTSYTTRENLESLGLPPHKTITLYTLVSQEVFDRTQGSVDKTTVAANDPDGAQENTREDESGSRDHIAIGEVLGEGGMGIVFLGQQRLPKREVAVKCLREPSPQLGNVLMHEAMTMGALEHPNIIPIHTVIPRGRIGPEVIMKRIQGESLSELLDGDPLNDEGLRRGLQILVHVCNALEFAHSNEIVHRDIKPENIMLGPFGEVYLVDWGIAVKLDGKNPCGVVGTPSYMAPEMLSGDPEDIDARTDVYLLGATLHEFLVGDRRHPSRRIMETLREAEVSNPYEYGSEVPGDLAAAANEACARLKDDRPDCVRKFRVKIEAHLSRWEAFQLRDTALEKLVMLREAVQQERETPEVQIQTHRLFSETRFGFEQALRIAPNCEGAMEGLQESLVLMVQILLEAGNVDFAEPLIDAMPSVREDLRRRMEKLRREQARLSAKAEEFKKLAAQFDRTTSRKERLWLASAVCICCVGLIGITMVYDHINKPQITAHRLLLTMGLVSLTTASLIFVGRKSLLSNNVGRRIATSLGFGTACFVLIGLAGLYTQAEGEAGSIATANMIMISDMVIVFLTFASSYPAIRTAPFICSWSLFAILTSIFIQPWTHNCLLLTGMVGSIGLVVDWMREDWGQEQDEGHDNSVTIRIGPLSGSKTGSDGKDKTSD